MKHFFLMILIVALSRGDDALQHAVAFVIGALLTATFDKHGSISRRKAVQHSV